MTSRCSTRVGRSVSPILNRTSSWRSFVILLAVISVGSTLLGGTVEAAQQPSPVQGVRLHILDCRLIRLQKPLDFDVSRMTSPTELVDTRHLIDHPKGTLIWDTGVVPDADVPKEQIRSFSALNTLANSSLPSITGTR